MEYKEEKTKVGKGLECQCPDQGGFAKNLVNLWILNQAMKSKRRSEREIIPVSLHLVNVSWNYEVD